MKKYEKVRRNRKRYKKNIKNTKKIIKTNKKLEKIVESLKKYKKSKNKISVNLFRLEYTKKLATTMLIGVRIKKQEPSILINRSKIK